VLLLVKLVAVALRVCLTWSPMTVCVVRGGLEPKRQGITGLYPCVPTKAIWSAVAAAAAAATA
jgi:hypothetical protein